jgi:AcrR family transcriptional regulator
MTPEASVAAGLRPRVEGDREQEILDAALEVLADSGYDRLTMDAVAHRAKASKATLYRRWNSKATLVVEALARAKGVPELPDTGDLRSDLLTAFCGMGGLTDHDTTATLDDGGQYGRRVRPRVPPAGRRTQGPHLPRDLRAGP